MCEQIDVVILIKVFKTQRQFNTNAGTFMVPYCEQKRWCQGSSLFENITHKTKRIKRNESLIALHFVNDWLLLES